ncbi:MAG: transporter substrate-binding domain-containing protein [Desulfobacterales bacterium]|nr:transporter substrate-binding domain-containing protein [Desulfobacterales bacterium]
MTSVLNKKLKEKLIAFLILFMVTFTFFPIGDSFSKNGKNIAEIEYGYPSQSIFVATINDKGQPDTPMNLVAGEILNRAGLSWHAMPYPARRLFDYLKNGKINFSILVRASSLNDSCIFSKKPIYNTKLNVYYIGNKIPVKTKEDLIGKHVITIRGYSYGGLRKFVSDPANNVTYEDASTHKAAFEMLSDNRADYLIDYASAANDILAVHPVKGLKSHSLSQLDIFLVLSKSYPEAETLMMKLEKIVETLNINEILQSKKTPK